MTQKTRELVWNKYGHRCAYCGKSLQYKEMQVDHLFPQHMKHLIDCPNMHKEDMGEWQINVDHIDHIDNLMPACRRCNFYKGGEALHYYRKKMQTIQDRLRKVYIVNVAEDFGIVKIQPWDGKFYFEKEGL
jgi:5-methylcytosine-specific restriction endonuclease McrA